MTAKKKSVKKAGGQKKAASNTVGSATTAAILGFSPPKKAGGKSKSKQSKTKSAGFVPTGRNKVKPEWSKYYNTLLDLRDRLLNQMDGLAKESAEQLQGYSLHMADSGTDNFDRDFALSLLSSDQDAVYEIEEALRRIEKKTYGTCELTGKTIPKARLDAIPWARFTVEAQAQLEKDGASRSRRLGQLGTVDSAAASHDSDDDDDASPKSSKSDNKD